MPSVDLARRAQWIVAAATAIAIAAAFRYPGGTALDTTTSGYSPARNFLSDLGMTVAYNHEPNRAGAAFFVVSLLLLVVGLGGVVAAVARFLAGDARSRLWARLAAAALLAACRVRRRCRNAGESSHGSAHRLHAMGVAYCPCRRSLPRLRFASQCSLASASCTRLVRHGAPPRHLCDAPELGANCYPPRWTGGASDCSEGRDRRRCRVVADRRPRDRPCAHRGRISRRKLHRARRLTIVAVDKRSRDGAPLRRALVLDSLATELGRYMATRSFAGPAHPGELHVRIPG